MENAYPFFPKSEFVPGKTLIIFEEIGDCPNARTSLKAFAEDGRYDVIGTGSLLGVANYRKRSKEKIPTGSETYLKMSSMDFEEFLWAINASEAFIEKIKASLLSFEALPEPYVDYGKAAIKAYMLVGGMPAAVKAYLASNGNVLEAREKNLGLLHDYEMDFGRYIDEKGNEMIDYVLKGRISAVWRSVPIQLARETGNSKFRFADLGGRGRKEDFSLAVDWLQEAGMILKASNTLVPEPPLLSNAIENEFKLFASDMGLLSACYEEALYQESLQGLLGARKGALVENLVATFIQKSGRKNYYYANSLAHKEIDFLLESQEGVILLEAKSTNGKMLASKALVEGENPYKHYKCYKVIESNFGVGSFYRTIPHYALPFFLDSLSERETIQIGIPKLNEEK